MAKKLRDIVIIDEDLCDGCGQCILSCDEGAIQIIDGKAKLVSANLCDGFGNCLGSCPQDAITIKKQEVEEYDEEAVKVHLASLQKGENAQPNPVERPRTSGGCPGSAVQSFGPAAQPANRFQQFKSCPGSAMQSFSETGTEGGGNDTNRPIPQTRLTQWPVQLMLVPATAPFLAGRELLIAADCVPFTYADFHDGYLKGKSLLVGCPKLDNLQFYRQKLEEVFRLSGCTGVTVMIMEVPCCGGLDMVTREAMKAAGSDIPLKEIVVGIRGDIISEREIAYK
ncbi:MAG: 4Fe-4S binding protein [Candidatus Zixiibacteriota bacterium]